MLNEQMNEWIRTEGECGEASLQPPGLGGDPAGPALLSNGIVREWCLLSVCHLFTGLGIFKRGFPSRFLLCFSISEESSPSMV